MMLDLNGKTVLVTGSAGFIGANLITRLMDEMESGHIISIDNMNDYYDPKLKEWRLHKITAKSENKNVSNMFVKADISNESDIAFLFDTFHVDIVVNLAAQAGVRYSIQCPEKYIQSNVVGFLNILEACRSHNVKHLVYASSSSVYGGNKKIPFSTDDNVDKPESMYAATKKMNELMAHVYSKIYGLPTTGLRFFTVYGPAGRPDMFYYSATEKLVRGEKIKIFNHGNMKRDFTYIDDIVEGIIRVMKKPPEKGVDSDGTVVPPYAVYNIGGGNPENLLDFITVLQEELIQAGVLPEDYDFEAHKEFADMQPGDVPVTYADTTKFERDFGFVPKVKIREGLREFAKWYFQFTNSEGK